MDASQKIFSYQKYYLHIIFICKKNNKIINQEIQLKAKKFKPVKSSLKNKQFYQIKVTEISNMFVFSPLF